MKNAPRKQDFTRAGLLKRLSAEEAASVNLAESAARLLDGEEYIDLKHPEQGVLRAQGSTTPRARVLARRAVHGDTWAKIVEQVTAFQRSMLN
ncbi:MAG TPA: hypothetical protein VNN80_02180 [Polyangiaceae bacterium]|nr:hypothetical protein [Polyangiaceae bacterium]